jgi:hypothetical protein
VDGSGSRLCQMMGFDISDVGSSGSAVMVS